MLQIKHDSVTEKMVETIAKIVIYNDSLDNYQRVYLPFYLAFYTVYLRTLHLKI